MPFTFFKRIPINRNTGINVSGSGVSVSTRHKYGSIGTRGFSIRTGIPGLTFRQSWSGGRRRRTSGLEALLILGLSILFIYIAWNALVLAVLIVYNIVSFVFYLMI